jgi:hypothetical protein
MPQLFDDLPEPRQSKILGITRTEKVARDEWLAHLETGLVDSLARYRTAGQGIDSDAVRGQILYYEHQISTIRWLRGLNWQWKEKGK